MGEVKLNLARKWRSKNFDEIIGQDLAVRMLKNGLFLHQYFPVYLFSGQRGCGKTSTARVFAAAVNCEQLDQFRTTPQSTSIPCRACKSCEAIRAGKHPDFIEIDAASHTGVDNVRSIIEAASLMPLLGRKKIYLIDEAHMLSKAAFNAFLKILEEPPASVLFILATTDPQKIIETVRSRCFQLFFNPVKQDVLLDRLQEVCTAERIAYDQEGLVEIIQQTEGSVRDALNVLEQVRFSSKMVSHQAVRNVLGCIDDTVLLALFERALFSTSSELLQYIKQMNIAQYDMQGVWSRLLALVRAALWIKHGVTPTDCVQHHAALRAIVSRCTVARIQACMHTMYEYHQLFNKTTAKYELFEMVLLSLCQHNDDSGSSGSSSPAQAPAVSQDCAPNQQDEEADEDEEDDEQPEDDDAQDDPLQAAWKRFIAKVHELDDPLVTSVFTQGTIKERTESTIAVEFSKQFVFFNDWLEQTKHEWQPLITSLFGDVQLKPLFTGAVAERKPIAVQPVSVPQPSVQAPKAKQQVRAHSYGGRGRRMVYKPFAQERSVDISDEDNWKTAHMLLRSIPGTVTEIVQPTQSVQK